jgi:hypothetical protein
MGKMNKPCQKRQPTPVVCRATLQVPEEQASCNGYQDQGIDAAYDFLRRAIPPRLLTLLDSLVPTPFANACLKMRRYLGDVLALAHHAASHLVAIRIDC